HPGAAAPFGVPVEPARGRAGDRRHGRLDAGLRQHARGGAALREHREPGGGREGRQARRRAGEGRRHHLGGVRPGRVPLPGARRRGRERCTRGRTGVLMALNKDGSDLQLRESRVININRVAKVEKGGRRVSFTAPVVIGDRAGRVGLGYGKAKEVPLASQQATEEARHNLLAAPLASATPTHPVVGVVGAGRVLLKPAAPGTGVIAGGAARAILEEAGIQDVLCKSLGSPNYINVARATIAGLQSLRRPDEIAELRGLPAEEIILGGLLRAYRESERGPAPDPTEVA